MVEMTMETGETVSERLAVESTDDQPAPRAIMSEVFRTLRDEGIETLTVEDLEVPEHWNEPASGGIIPEFMVGSDDSLAQAIWNGTLFQFSGSNDVEGARDISGQHHMTTVFVRTDVTVAGMIRKLVESGQVAGAMENVAPLCEGRDATPAEVVGYALATYAKGWVAEAVIVSGDRFSKGSQSNDEAGQDVLDTESGEYRQIRCVTDRDNGVLCYQWDCRGHIHLGEVFKEVNKRAGEVSGRVVPYTGEIKPTETLRCHGQANTTSTGRAYRFLWW